jgi:hypothetical protein
MAVLDEAELQERCTRSGADEPIRLRAAVAVIGGPVEPYVLKARVAPAQPRRDRAATRDRSLVHRSRAGGGRYSSRSRAPPAPARGGPRRRLLAHSARRRSSRRSSRSQASSSLGCRTRASTDPSPRGSTALPTAWSARAYTAPVEPWRIPCSPRALPGNANDAADHPCWRIEADASRCAANSHALRFCHDTAAGRGGLPRPVPRRW